MTLAEYAASRCGPPRRGCFRLEPQPTVYFARVLDHVLQDLNEGKSTPELALQALDAVKPKTRLCRELLAMARERVTQ